MAKADRLARLDDRRVEMEAEYEALLVAALRQTAAKRLLLFGHQQERTTMARAAPVVAEITTLGEEIDDLRAQLAIGPFALHQEFVASRGPVSAHAVGEPKQAQAWLDRLDATKDPA
ncbi:hypothetical protein AB5I39_11590 [Sphingomonas sp. MMS24-J45]|uniref:hypothetical protein n=1 Tax=Sphingomonas sp. MMS24-J45 TaxID=3238806 RepID=UPI00384EFC53